MISKNKIIISVLLSSGGVFTSAHAASQMDETAAVKQVLAQYQQALNASDTKTIANLYAKDGIQMAPDAPAAVGQDAVEQAYAQTFNAITLNLTFNVDEVKLLDENHALLRSHSNGTMKINGQGQSPVDVAFKELFILEKEPAANWKFSHYSFSRSGSLNVTPTPDVQIDSSLH